jgi:NTE family protein
MTATVTPDESRVDLVFEGGGVKGIGLAGAYSALEERGYHWQHVAGTSAGAITAAMVAAGYDSHELQDLVLSEMKFKQFEDGHQWPLAEEVEILRHKGLHPGTYFEGWMRDHLQEKGVRTFGDLRPQAPPGGEPDYPLQIIASDLTHRRMLVLPRDAQKCLGTAPDELEVAVAVRMSMSIPIFFDPVIYTSPTNSADQHLIVDGGILSNFPVWLFDVPQGQVPRWPTLGLLLVPPDQKDPLEPGPEVPSPAQGKVSAIGYLLAIGHTMMEAHDRLYIDQANFARTIPISTLGVQTTQFSIDDDPDLKKKLYESGRDAVTEFLKTWDFDAYKLAFRSGAQPSRRERVAAVFAQNRATPEEPTG